MSANSTKSLVSTKPAAPTTPAKRSISHSKESQSAGDDDALLLLLESDRKIPRTPPKTNLSSKVFAGDDPRIVTPASSSSKVTTDSLSGKRRDVKSNARRVLGMVDEEEDSNTKEKDELEENDEVAVEKKKLPFGGTKKTIYIPPNVQLVYNIIHKYTGSIGGNGHGGGIYGELTPGSMQRMINLMIQHTGLSKDSRFIDVGCGWASQVCTWRNILAWTSVTVSRWSACVIC